MITSGARFDSERIRERMPVVARKIRWPTSGANDNKVILKFWTSVVRAVPLKPV